MTPDVLARPPRTKAEVAAELRAKMFCTILCRVSACSVLGCRAAADVAYTFWRARMLADNRT